MTLPPRVSRLLPWLLLAGCLASLPFLVHPWYTPYRDSAMYLTCAQSLAETGSYSYLGAPFTLRPPGFALFLAPILLAAGHNFLAMNVAVSLTGAAGILFLFLLARGRIGELPALALAVAVWLNPLWQELCTSILSDIPGLALAFAALALERRLARTPSRRGELALGLIIGVASLVRSIYVLLLPAVLASRFLLRGRRPAEPWRAFLAGRVLPLCAAALLTIAPWSVRNALVRDPGPSVRTGIASYGTAQWHQKWGDPDSPLITPAQLVERVRENAVFMTAALGSRGKARRDDARPPASTVAAAVLLLAGGFAALLRRREPQDFFLAANVAVLLIYFDLQVRLFLPILVLALLSTLDSAAGLLARLGRPRLFAPAAVALLAVVAVADLGSRGRWDLLRARHEHKARQGAAIAALVPPGARLGAWHGTEWSPYLGRPVYGLVFPYRLSPRRQTVEEIIDLFGLEMILDTSGLPEQARRHLAATYGSAATPVPGTSLTLYRVRPPAAP